MQCCFYSYLTAIEYCLMLREQYVSYILYILDENKMTIIYKLYRNEGGMGKPGNRLIIAIEKVWKVGQEKNMQLVFFCNGKNAFTLFLNLKKRFLTCRECSTLQIGCPLWFTVSFFLTPPPLPHRYQGTTCPCYLITYTCFVYAKSTLNKLHDRESNYWFDVKLAMIRI